MSSQSDLLVGQLKRLRISMMELSRRTGIQYENIRKYVHGERKIARPDAITIAEAIFPDRLDRKENFVNELFPTRKATVGLRPHDLSVYALQYGHLTVEETVRTVDPKFRYSGPTGFLIDIFRNFSLIGDCDQLVPSPVRPTLKQALCSEATNHAYLGNLATIDRLRTDYFFCTPITIGTQGLIRLDDRRSRGRVTAIREALTFSNPGNQNLVSPIYMPSEIGHHLVRALWGDVKSLKEVSDLSVSECATAFANAEVSSGDKSAVLLMDELTCFLVAGHYHKGPLALAFQDVCAPRYPFGFSIPRGNEELRRWFKVSFELYLQIHWRYVAEMLLRLYESLVEFARQLNKKSQDSALDFFPDPHAWAALVVGVDVPDLRSTLMCRAWQPIIEFVHRKIRSMS